MARCSKLKNKKMAKIEAVDIVVWALVIALTALGIYVLIRGV